LSALFPNVELINTFPTGQVVFPISKLPGRVNGFKLLSTGIDMLPPPLAGKTFK
jgi:hypothetical protein